MAYNKWIMNDDRVIRIRSLVLCVLGIACAYVWTLPHLGYAADSEFTITFLNVGQGDAILIETPDGIQVLIDGGPDGSVLRELSRELGRFDRTIDMVVATHPDADHIGGLVDVLARYEVDTILLTENETDTPVSDQFRARVEAEGAEVVHARAGAVFALGASTTMRVLFPRSDPSAMESNASSIVLQVSHGEFDALLTGDAPSRIEEFLLTTYGDALRSEILKFGHHGSNTSSSDAFVAAVSPEFGIVSAGKDNRYGHPHREVLDIAAAHGVTVLRTMDGAITFVSDGMAVSRR